MNNETDIQVIKAFQNLSNKIAAIVENELSQGTLVPEAYTYARDRIDEIITTDHDLIRRKKSSVEFVIKELWCKAGTIVFEYVKEPEEYRLAFHLISNSSLSSHEVSRLLEVFTLKLSSKFLETTSESHRQEYIETLLYIVLRHLNGELFICSSEVKLEGIVVRTNPIEFIIGGAEYHLRNVTIEDFAHEELYFGFRESLHDDPSAILHIKMSGRATHELQPKVEQAITIFRLFKVSGVRYLSYTMESESLTDFFALGGGGINDRRQLGGVGRYVIEDDDVPRLINFSRQLGEVLPPEGYNDRTSQVEPVAIAYQRYSDALLSFGTIERKIADAVMGLESLFLKGSENQELNYRLRMRVAKMLGLLGRDPYSTRQVVNDAYIVRSAFVHGDAVQGKAKREIEKRHESLMKLLKATLDLLRIGIVTFTIIDVDKDDLISLMDDSYIDKNKLPEIEQLIERVKPLA